MNEFGAGELKEVRKEKRVQEKEKIEGKERENTKKNKKCSCLKEPKYRGICEERREKREKRESEAR